MVEIAVIADDLTGAADTGIQFRPVYANTVLMADMALTGDCTMPRPDVLAIHTRTRAASPEDARRRIAEIAKRLRPLEPRRVYKKVDSCLRGNLGAETDALLQEFELDLSFIAPAFPTMGRTTVHDVHLLHGEPVAESEMGRDPVTPVLNSNLTAIVAGQARLPVGRIDLDILESGTEAVASEVSRLRESGIRHICFDAGKQAHLEIVASLTRDRFPTTLLVGSAGLGLALRTVLSLPPAPEAAIRENLPSGHHLLAFGTASPQARRQIDVMRRTYPMQSSEIAAGDLLDGGPAVDGLLDELTGLMKGGDLVICIALPDAAPDAQMAARLAGQYGKLIAALIVRTRPVTTFLSGGDTAIAVLDSLGAQGIRLEREITPTMACGTAVGGAADGLIFGTKPGAMGNDDAMLEWRRFWDE